MPSDLNVRVAHRVSVALVLGMLLICALRLTQPPVSGARPALLLLSLPWIVGSLVVLAVALFALNYDLYRFFARRRGVAFAVRTLPLHWLYYGYCGLSVALGLCAYVWGKLTPQRHATRLPALPGS